MTTSPARPHRSGRGRTALGIALVCGVVAAGVTPLVLGGAAAAAAPLAAPPVVGPADAASVRKEVVLDWAPVAGAASYVVQVGTDEQWSDEPTLELKTVATRLTLPAWLPHASYVWRVAGVSALGQGRWSAEGTFTRGWASAPQLLSPGAGAVDPALGVPTFRWTPVPTASEYQLQVSTSPYFDAPFDTQAGVGTESCFTTRTTVTPFNGQADAKSNDSAGDCVFGLLGSGTPLHWRVRALDQVVDDLKEVPTSPVVDEGISSRPPASSGELDLSACPKAPAPSPTTPADGGGQAGGGGGGWNLGDIKVPPIGSVKAPAPPPNPAAPAAPPDGSTDDAPAKPAPSASPTGELGACEPAHDVEKGRWSASRSFSHTFPRTATAPYFGDLPTPARPTASSPLCKQGVCRDFPTVTWLPVPGAQWYRLSVALDAAYSNVQAIAETPATTWTPTTAWRDSSGGAAFHIVVQACTVQQASDGRGPGCAAPSEALVVRKSTPRLTTATPGPGALVPGSEVVLSWAALSSTLGAATAAPATSEAAAYRVQVARADNPDFLTAGLVEEALVDATHHVSATLRYADGTYLWRVQPVDASGHKLPWSPVQTFTRDGTAPTWSVVSAGRLAPGAPVTVRFSEPVLGADARSVSLPGLPAALAVARDGRSATLTAQRPLLPGATLGVAVSAAVRDRAGNPAPAGRVTASVDPVVDDRSPALALGGAWQRLAATNAVAGTWSRSVPTAASRTSATVVLQGRGAEVKGCVGPAAGVLEVWGDGKRLSRVDAYRSYSGCGVVLARAVFPKAGVHRVEVRGTGTKSPRSRGTAVAVDAVTAVR